MSTNLEEYYFLPAAFRGALANLIEQAQNIYSDPDATEAIKAVADGINTETQAIANGLNHSFRWQLFGSTPNSTTTPEAPDIDTSPPTHLS